MSSTVSQSLLKFMSTESVNALYHFIHCWPLHSSPSTFPRIRVYSNDSALHVRWPKYWSFSFSISPSNNIGLISFRIDWFDLHAVQGISQESYPASHFGRSISSVLSLFMVQLSHLYMTTGKTIALTIWTFVGKMISPLFNMLPTFVIAFLPRSKHLLILWL